LRFLLDTNIVIPLEDSSLPLRESLSRFVALAHANDHYLLYHPASLRDLMRDKDESRRQSIITRLQKYERLETSLECPWNTPETSPNDACDNEILYALECDAVDALVTEDRGIHKKAIKYGLGKRVYAVQAAEDFLDRLHERQNVTLPNIDETHLHEITPLLGNPIFDSLKAAYQQFETWFRSKARAGRKAWVYWRSDSGELGAICIFARQSDVQINDAGDRLHGEGLKLCTFKVAEDSRGKKVGELFLKIAFRYATANYLQSIFIHTDATKHPYLVGLLEDFGFAHAGVYDGDDVYLKLHPQEAPSDDGAMALSTFEYHRRFFPHFRVNSEVQKFLIPIRPEFHDILFPDCTTVSLQASLFTDASENNSAGNAIKLAYLCHSPTKSLAPGDIILFYRSTDLKSITSLGVVEEFKVLQDPSTIARLVSRRTVYSMPQIERMAEKDVRVILFRLVSHFDQPVEYDWLKKNRLVQGNIQSIQKISDETFRRVLDHG
jgi:GNAT superfamily N-acetyltransferase